MIVQDSSVAEVLGAENFLELSAEYAAESAIEGLPPPVAKFDQYAVLEAAGILHFLSATIDGRVVGFISVLVGPSPRYAAPVAMSESFFVAKAHRNTGAGLKLLAAAETKAQALGSGVLMVSAPYAGDLFQVLPRRGYKESSRVFVKRLAPAYVPLSLIPSSLPAQIPAQIPTMGQAALGKVRAIERLNGERPQIPIDTSHIFHAGLYARTVVVPAGVLITGVLIKCATLLIVQGDALAYIGEDEPLHLQGYVVLPASAGRKQAFFAHADTHLTMIFATRATGVAEAEEEFTDELDLLASRRDAGRNHVVHTGE